MDRSLRVPHPSATARSCPRTVRLACVRHAASVRSEPGSNSQVHHTTHLTVHRTTNTTRTRRSFPPTREKEPSKHCLTRKIRQSSVQKHQPTKSRSPDPEPNQPTINQENQTLIAHSLPHRTPPTYPFHSRCNCQRTEPHAPAPAHGGIAGPLCSDMHPLRRKAEEDRPPTNGRQVGPPPRGADI